MTTVQIQEISKLLDPSEVIHPDSPEYARESQVWAKQKNLHPKLIVRPRSTEALASVVKYLAKTNLDFNVRSQGYGPGSAKDVLVSISAFNDFSFDRESETVMLGAGQSWTDVYNKLEQIAPDYQGTFNLSEL